jgi:hypothetical protein
MGNARSMLAEPSNATLIGLSGRSGGVAGEQPAQARRERPDLGDPNAAKARQPQQLRPAEAHEPIDWCDAGERGQARRMTNAESARRKHRNYTKSRSCPRAEFNQRKARHHLERTAAQPPVGAELQVRRQLGGSAGGSAMTAPSIAA